MHFMEVLLLVTVTPQRRPLSLDWAAIERVRGAIAAPLTLYHLIYQAGFQKVQLQFVIALYVSGFTFADFIRLQVVVPMLCHADAHQIVDYARHQLPERNLPLEFSLPDI